MATIQNAIDTALQAAGTRVLTAALPSNYTVDFSLVNGSTKPSNNADVTLTAVNGGITVTGGGLTLSGGGSIKGGQTAYATGTGWFLGFSGAAYKFSIGDATHYLRWDGTGMTIAGDISGTSSINITGTAQFGGATSASGSTWAVVANLSNGSVGGVLAFSTAGGVAVYAVGQGTHGNGVSASGADYGVQASATGANGFGLDALAASGLAAVRMTGAMRWGNGLTYYTWIAPDGSVTKAMFADGTWKDLTAQVKLVSAGNASAGSALGYLVIDTLGGAGQVKVPYYAL